MTEHTTTPPLPLGLRPADLVTAAATGLLTLPDPARRTPLTRFALRSAVAATAGAGVWVGTGEDRDLALDLARRAAFTAGAVGLVYGASELGEAVDAAVQRRLVRLGVRRPRLVAALTGVGLSLVMSVLERRTTDADEDDDALAAPTVRDLPHDVRELVGAVLEQTEDHDSLRLRAQLALAREEVWGQDPAPQRFVELAVPEDVPLAVPHDFTFPVSARFTSARGVPCAVSLLVSRGKLATVVVDVADETWDRLAETWHPGDGDDDPLADVGLPRAAEVTFVTEAAGRP